MYGIKVNVNKTESGNRNKKETSTNSDRKREDNIVQRFCCLLQEEREKQEGHLMRRNVMMSELLGATKTIKDQCIFAERTP